MGFLERLLGGHRSGEGHHGYDNKHGRGHAPSPQAAGIACPSCRAANAASARFCQQCGASLAPVGCAGCSAPMQPGAKFCAQCGRSSG
ncbi:zinc ribbon domain-containing protein [Pseudorhodoferax sp. LjRoot39]|uniref:double zinc ribbon domain-containing protein n=1 Tax=Pseudorhodoferax sp. LjRoot39 TaxID=3342328 RepID=UPI003ECCE423